MKKLLLLASLTASLTAYGLPTYEPFTEFTALVTSSPTNAIDLCSNGLTAPTGEMWGSLNYSGLAGNTSGIHGLDVVVTNFAGNTVFTSNNLSALLPTTFPGFPGFGQAINIMAFNPAQNAGNSNTVGNSAVLQFAQDITRPVSGTKTLFISYLLDIPGKGQAGANNTGRYLGFLAQSNLFEPSATYPTFLKLFNVFGTTKYFGHGVCAPAAPDELGPTDSFSGKEPNPFPSTFTLSFNSPNFVVGEFTFTTSGTGSLPDTNTMWVNPAVSTFGGAAPPTSQPVVIYPMNIAMSDVAGMVLIDRVGSGSLGGVSNTYIANLIIGSTWSYVTGGPEFTNQPVGVSGTGSSVSLSAAATAAGQTVSYQWQHITGSGPMNVTSGAGGAGGGATVTIVTNANITTMMLVNMSAADAGSYQVVATASGTGFSLASTTVTVTNDPIITVEPISTSAPLGGNATFNISASTANAPLSFQWKLNGANISNGTLPDNSTVNIVTNSNSSTLTLGNYQSDENPATITCGVTNGLGNGELSVPAIVTKADPAFTAQPSPFTANFGGTATFTASLQTSHPGLSYAWYFGTAMLVNGLQADGSTVSGASGSIGGSSATSTLTVSSVSYLDAGSYSLRATNGLASTGISSPAILTVNDPFITAEPPGTLEVAAGMAASIAVGAAGTSPTYQWVWTNGSGAGGITGDLTGATSSAIQISPAQAADSGTYSVVVSGTSGQTATSAATVLTVENPVTAVTVGPASLLQQAGTHLAVVGTITGGDPLVHLQWTHNGANLANGPQADGSWISNAVTTFAGNGVSALFLSNAQVLDSGAYVLVASNANGVVSNAGASVITISPGLLPLSTTNLVVSRVGEGSEPLSGLTGNTMYLDQFETNGAYVSSIQVPDSGTNSLLVIGAGADGGNGAYITQSSNGAYLNFAGYFQNYPAGNVVVQGVNGIRSLGAVNGLGYYVLAYTNFGLYSGGAGFIRDAYSTDGLTNFWTTGAAGSTAVKYVQFGPGGAGYATGNGVPGLSDTVNGPMCIGLAGTNLVFSDNSVTDTNGLLGVNGGPPYLSAGLDVFAGTPLNNPAGGGATNEVSTAGAADFAYSPDQNTLYIADSSTSIAGGTSQGGGVQRWDLVGGVYTYQYTLEDTTGSGTNGIRGLAVNFPSSITTWGQGANGAIIYATTAEAVTNRLIVFTDNGATSTPAVLATAGPNEFLRGVRFGPATVPVTIPTGPVSANTFVGQSDTLTVIPSGDAPFTFQWQFDGTNISGATTTSLVLTNLQLAQSGTYTVVVSDPVSTNSSSAVVNITAGPPLLIAGPQSLIESAGDHTAFSVAVTGTLPIFFQWATNGINIPGATGSSLVLTNITTTNNGTYSVTYSNQFGTNTKNATLLVTSSLQPLSSNNLIVARIGDGAQPLSSITGNTLYLDQVTPAGVYSNTIMVPDNQGEVADLIVRGGAAEEGSQAFVTTSANSAFLNFCGYDTNYPDTSSPPFVDAPTGAVGDVFRSIGAVNAFGFFGLAQTNETLYTAAVNIFECVTSADGFAEFWTTGAAGSGAGIKYATPALAGPAGGNVGIGGSTTGNRVVQIIGGNIYYSDAGKSPIGIWQFTGEPTTGSTGVNVIGEVSGSPNDFAFSPDLQTVYVADDRASTSGGGIQRWDMSGGVYVLSYTLGTGAGSTAGASGLAADFSAATTWGPGVNGAIVYATTAAASGNSLIKIFDTDAGSGSSAVVLEKVNPNEILRGVRFGPVEAPPVIVSNPQPASIAVGGTTNFSTFAVNGPITGYQWQVNGTNLTNGSSSVGIVAGAQTPFLTVSSVPASADQSGFAVVISNPFASVTTTVAVLSMPVSIITPPPAVEYVTNGGTATFTVVASGGLPLTYQWIGPCGTLSDGPGTGCDPSSTIAGSSTATVTLSNVSAADDGSFYAIVHNTESSGDTSATPTVLTVVTPPVFASPPVTGLPASPQLNFSGTAGTTYHIWGSTNLALKPISSAWTLLGTGTFSGGADSFPFSATNRLQFFAITQP